MKLLKKLFKPNTKVRKINIDSDAIESLLNTVDFYKEKVPSSFYSELLEIYSVSIFEKENPRHLKGYEEFKNIVKELSEIYDNIIGSSFQKELLNNFITKFEEYISKQYDLPGIKTFIAIYWYQPIRKTRTDIQNSKNNETIEIFEDFHSKIRKIIDGIMLNN